MRQFILVSLVFFSSCGLPVPRLIEPKYLPFVERFEREGLARGKDVTQMSITIETSDIGIRTHGETVGYCIFRPDGAYVEIDKNTWESSGDGYRESLIFHELGHCLLKKEHSPDKNSLMFHDVMNGEIYQASRKACLDELFQ